MKQIPFVGGLKGLCAILVLLGHMSICFKAVSPFFEIYAHRPNFLCPAMAVNLFILIGGYLAAIGIQEGKNISSMLLKRYFRIALPIAVVLLLMGFLKIAGLLYSDKAGDLLQCGWLKGEPRTYSGLIKAMFMSPFGNYYGWLNPLWMMKYLLFAPAVVVLLHLSLYKLSSKAVVFLCLFWIYLFFRYDYYYINLIVGFLFVRVNCVHKYLGISSLVALIALELLGHSYQHVEMLRAILFFLICLNSKKVSNLLSVKPLIFLGNISMGIYLLHVLILSSLSSWMYIELPSIWIKMPIIEITTVTCVIMTSYFFLLYVEKPISRMINVAFNKR